MRLYVLVEGQTEEQSSEGLLAPHLRAFGLDVRFFIVATSRDAFGRKTRGGGRWASWSRDLRHLMKEHRGNDVRFSTMFDLYGLPKDFPALDKHGSETNTTRRAEELERAMASSVNDWRFVPYLQRHEFEALVLAGLPQLKELLDAPADLAGHAALSKELVGVAPEDVNDGIATAPSKRLDTRIPGYRKTVHGPLVVEAVGLPRLRQACPRFDAWISKLEAFGTPPAA